MCTPELAGRWRSHGGAGSRSGERRPQSPAVDERAPEAGGGDRGTGDHRHHPHQEGGAVAVALDGRRLLV